MVTCASAYAVMMVTCASAYAVSVMMVTCASAYAVMIDYCLFVKVLVTQNYKCIISTTTANQFLLTLFFISV